MNWRLSVPTLLASNESTIPILPIESQQGRGCRTQPGTALRLLPTPPQPARHRLAERLPFVQLRVVTAALERPVRRVRQLLQLTCPGMRRRDEIEDALGDED